MLPRTAARGSKCKDAAMHSTRRTCSCAMCSARLCSTYSLSTCTLSFVNALSHSCGPGDRDEHRLRC